MDESNDAVQELARLRAENERLRAMVAGREAAGGTPRRPRRAGRWSAAAIFLLIGCLLLPVGAIALWARTVIFDTDRYVATVAPLARNPAVRNAVADRITAEVFATLDINALAGQAIDGLVKQGAPAELAALRQPVVNGVESFARTQIHRVVSTDVFANAWEQANQAAHAGLVAALRGTQGGTIEVQGGTVSVNLGAFIQSVKPQLIAAGIPFADRIPAVNISFPILTSTELPRFQRAAALLDTLAVPLVVLAFLLLAVAVWLAPNRRRMLSVAGFGMAGILLLLLGALALGRGYYLAHLPANAIPEDAGAVVWDTLAAQFIVRVKTVIAVGLVIGTGAWLVGPGALARALRTGGTTVVTAARVGGRRIGWPATAADRWVAGHVAALRAGAVALIVVVYVLWDRPTGAVVLWLTLALLALVAVIELLRTGADLPADEPPAAFQVPPPAVPVG
jgi:hypothetical protein